MQSKRVASRYASEVLTKEWLMGVRRGWLAILDPNIRNWDDVDAAFKRMGMFIHNLTEQIFYVRRGPYSGSMFMSEGKRVLKILGGIAEIIDDHRSRAKHWRNVAEGKTSPGFKPSEGEYMFELYKNDFVEATKASVERRGGGRWDQVPITDLLDKALKVLREDAQRIKDHDKANPTTPYEGVTPSYKEFDLHGMKVVIDDSSVLPTEISEYIRYFDEAYQRLKQKGFGKAWYGTLFVKCQSCGGENPLGKDYGVGGDYRYGPDTVQVYMRPSSGVVHLVIHELGHRYWFKTMTPFQRAKFEILVKVKNKPKPTDPEELKVWQNAWDDAGKPVFPVSEYGGSNIAEAFAEVFADYMLGKDLTRDQLESFKEVVKKARSVPLDKPEIRNFTDFLEKKLGELASRHNGPFGSKVLGQWPFEIKAVDGTPLKTYVRFETVPAKDNDFLQGGGVGFLRGTPIVVVRVNGSIDADALRRGAETHIIKIQLYNLLIHELTHVADKYLRGVGESLSEQELRNNPAAYYNHPSELHAFMQEVVDQVSQRFVHYEKLKQRFGQKAIGMLLNFSTTWQEVSPHWTERNRQKVLKAVFQALEEWDRSKMKTARTETLDAAWVERMRKDFLTLMKNLPRVSDYDQGAVLRDGFKTYRTNFKTFMFDDFLNPRKERDDASFEGIRKQAWDFYLELSMPLGYPDEYNSKEMLYERYKRDSVAWERRLRSRAQVFWKDLKDTLSYRQDGKVEVETPDVDRLVLEGFQVDIRAFKPSEDWQQEALAKFKEGLRQYRKKASRFLPWLIQKQLPLLLDFDSKLDEGGEYHGTYIRIAMSSVTGNSAEWSAHMLAHEMGHHLFKGLSKSAREFWDTAIRQDYGPLDVDELLDKWPENLKWSSDFVEYMATKDPVLALQVDVLSLAKGGDKAYEKRDDFENAYSPTLPVPKNPITGYAGKNTEESFCEAIGRLVGYGPATVLPQIKHWLTIALPGAVKLAGEAMKTAERSKKVKLGYRIVDTRTGEAYTKIVPRKDDKLRDQAKKLQAEGKMVGIQTVEVHVPESWKKGDDLEPYAPRDVLEGLKQASITSLSQTLIMKPLSEAVKDLRIANVVAQFKAANDVQEQATKPLETGVTVYIDMDGDPVFVVARAGDIPVDLAREQVEKMVKTKVTMKPGKSSSKAVATFTAHWDKAGKSVTAPIEIKWKLKKTAADTQLQVGKWYKHKHVAETYFLVKDTQKNGGWSGLKVVFDRAHPKAKKDSIRPGGLGSNQWSEIKESDVPAEIKEAV